MGGVPLPSLSAGPSMADGYAAGGMTGDFIVNRQSWQESAVTIAALAVGGFLIWKFAR